MNCLCFEALNYLRYNQKYEEKNSIFWNSISLDRTKLKAITLLTTLKPNYKQCNDRNYLTISSTEIDSFKVAEKAFNRTSAELTLIE